MQNRDFDRVRWRCRRGLLELDLILQGFVERHWERLDGKQRELFNELLDLPDNDLLDWALGRGDPPDPRYLGVIRLLQAR